MTIETIHTSLVNGQFKQTYKQIIEYGYEEFFEEYSLWLTEQGLNLSWYVKITILYLRLS